MNKTTKKVTKLIALSSLIIPSMVFAADDSPKVSSTLFTNVNIFNGTENKLYKDHNVLE